MGAISGSIMTSMPRNLGAKLSLAMIIIMILAAGCSDGGEAQENQITIDTLFSGSGTDSLIDTNGDGIRALFVTANGSVSGLGRINFTEAVETQPKDPAVPCTTPDGGEGIEYELVQGNLALQVQESGDIITGEFIADTQCFPLDPGSGSSVAFEGQWMATGGTGRFVNSSGTVNVEGVARILLADTSGIFVIASSVHSGVIEINQ